MFFECFHANSGCDRMDPRSWHSFEKPVQLTKGKIHTLLHVQSFQKPQSRRNSQPQQNSMLYPISQILCCCRAKKGPKLPKKNKKYLLNSFEELTSIIFSSEANRVINPQSDDEAWNIRFSTMNQRVRWHSNGFLIPTIFGYKKRCNKCRKILSRLPTEQAPASAAVRLPRYHRRPLCGVSVWCWLVGWLAKLLPNDSWFSVDGEF